MRLVWPYPQRGPRRKDIPRHLPGMLRAGSEVHQGAAAREAREAVCTAPARRVPRVVLLHCKPVAPRLCLGRALFSDCYDGRRAPSPHWRKGSRAHQMAASSNPSRRESGQAINGGRTRAKDAKEEAWGFCAPHLHSIFASFAPLCATFYCRIQVLGTEVTMALKWSPKSHSMSP